MKIKLAIGAAVVLGLAAAYWGLSESGALDVLRNEQALRSRIDRLGFWGPLAVILLIASAIVVTPLPSAPVAVAAGAAYGPVWGTAYVIAGSEAGALIAFLIARYLGFEAVQRWLRGKLDLDLGHERSQRALMAVVFATRLVPFVSFDAVSYAAGLTPLTFWRFAVATVAGVAPISFLLTYFGEDLVSQSSEGLITIVLLVGGITLVPIGLRFLWTRYREREEPRSDG